MSNHFIGPSVLAKNPEFGVSVLSVLPCQSFEWDIETTVGISNSVGFSVRNSVYKLFAKKQFSSFLEN